MNAPNGKRAIRQDANERWYGALNNTPGLVGPLIEPPPAIHEYYRQWMARDGYPFWPFWENISSWWAVRDLPNVNLIHFNEMKADLAGSIRTSRCGADDRRTAGALGIEAVEVAHVGGV